MGLQIRAVIFDLDGTIYQNTAFHRDYLHFLVEGTGRATWERQLVAFTEAVFAGRRLVMNRFYENHCLSAETPGQFFHLLEGRLCPLASYGEALGRTGVRYLGDAWAVVTLLGEALGLLENGRCDQVYRRTRRRMEQTGMRGDPALGDTIAALAGRCRVVLASNSYGDTVSEFLRQLGFEHLFPSVCSSANKPYDLISNLQRLAPDILEEPERVVTIGDNAFNDLMPLAELGARTVWINPFPGTARPACDVELATTRELAEFLQTL